jgi:hypothetical protein
MASQFSFEEVFRRAAKANMQYVEGLGRVFSEYVNALTGIFRDLPPGARSAWKEIVQRPAPALVLEGQAGERARGAFMVDNRLGRAVTAPVQVSPFSDAAGVPVALAMDIEPRSLSLPPGGQALVEVFVAISDSLGPGASYRGEISVPGLADRSIPILVRRLPTPPTAG